MPKSHIFCNVSGTSRSGTFCPDKTGGRGLAGTDVSQRFPATTNTRVTWNSLYFLQKGSPAPYSRGRR